MNQSANVAIWGCIVCSNVWSASQGGPIKYVLGAVWVAFAVVILCVERRQRTARYAGDEWPTTAHSDPENDKSTDRR